MKKFSTLFSLLTFSTMINLSMAQNNTTATSPNTSPAISQEQVKDCTMINGERVYTNADEMPSFPGGTDAFASYLKSNIKYPEQAKSGRVYGKVFISFVIGRDGTVKNAAILRGIGNGCDEEALRVVNMMPKWNPGQKDGRPVAVQYALPINFTNGDERQK